jgi:hypothetical protein
MHSAMNAPACFQVILARSALYKKSAGQYGTILERAELDTAIVEHKTHAIHRIQQLSKMKDNTGPGSQDELVASIISLGTLEMRMGSTESGDVHYSAVRRLLKSIGGPMNIRDLRLTRVMCFFECIYGTPRNSYIWEKDDFGGILERFNEYLAQIYEIWKERDGEQDGASKKTSTGDKGGFPFPSTSTKTTSESPAKQGKTSKRKPTGPHSPYFGLQPPPEVVPKPPAPTTQSVPDRSAPSRISPSAHDRILKATASAKRPARSDARPPAKERARHSEKQKMKARAMDIDPPDPREGSAMPQPHHATDASPPNPQPRSRPPAASGTVSASVSASDMPPPPPTSTPKPTSFTDKYFPPSSSPKTRDKSTTYWTLPPTSALHQRLTLTLTLPPATQEKNLIWDLACLFCLCSIVTSPSFSQTSSSSHPSLSTYLSHLSHIISTANLHVSESNANMMWLMQTNDGSPEHTARMWDVAGWVWVCKHLNGRVRKRLREWVWGFLTGEELGKEREGGRKDGREVLTVFDFSYNA